MKVRTTRLSAKGTAAVKKLIKLLLADAKNKKGIKFDMGDWGTITDKKKPVSCGTTACALGLAALSGKFPGLRYDVENSNVNISYKKGRIIGYNAEEAAALAFDMPLVDATYLFTVWPSGKDTGANSEKAMAKRLQDYIDGKKVKCSTWGVIPSLKTLNQIASAGLKITELRNEVDQLEDVAYQLEEQYRSYINDLGE